MQVTITIPAIGDGDAIIVFLERAEKKLLFLIDGGRVRNETIVTKALTNALEATGLEAPDFILCTHYDDDHIGGLTAIVKRYKKAIGKVWVHATSEKYDRNLIKQRMPAARKKSGIFPLQASSYLRSDVNADSAAYNNVITNLQQEINFLELLDGLEIPVGEPIAESFTIDGWPELRIIAPTLSLYKALFPESFKTEQLIKAEVDELIADQSTAVPDAGKALDELPKKGLTATNVNSAMLMLTVGKQKFLFAADSGIQSFEAVSDHESLLADLHWLKVPHHGSFKNLDSRLITLMHPEIAVISGDHHVSEQVVTCFEQVNSHLFITSRDGDYIYEENFPDEIF